MASKIIKKAGNYHLLQFFSISLKVTNNLHSNKARAHYRISIRMLKIRVPPFVNIIIITRNKKYLQVLFIKEKVSVKKS